MTAFYVIVENLSDWQPYYPSQDVITFDDYLETHGDEDKKRIRVINLCRSYRYLSTGYYCSLLAEARGHNVFPSTATINNLQNKSLTTLQLEDSAVLAKKLELTANSENTYVFRCWFGQTLDPNLEKIGRYVFEKFPCPLLEVTLQLKKEWQIKQVKSISLKALTNSEEQEAFANAFEKFSAKMWLKPKAKKAYRYDMAILVNPDEALPPSDKKALSLFQKAGRQLGIESEIITRKSYMRLPEYDALFIRETTSVNHHTYQFARKAEAEGMVVMDDPTSILRCTNKVYLADLLKTKRIPTPKTYILNQPNEVILQKLATEIGFPMVLKIPDGSFSRGVIKAENKSELLAGVEELMKSSALILAQEFLYTQYDWRIGVINNKPLYACRYYMVADHWQIYKYNTDEPQSGKYETLPTFEVPKAVLDIAVKATRLIGNGLYGVDIKQSGDRVVVIEVNDNPSIESGVEDKYLGEQLYLEIMGEFLRRLEARGR